MRCRLALAASLALLVACSNEREEELRAEIARLREERVETTAVEKAREESRSAEEALAAARAALEQMRAELAAREAQAEALRAAVDAEAARSQRLQASLEQVVARAQAEAERGTELAEAIAREQERAALARAQAAALARELRAGDPGWATERRLASLEELAADVAKEFPRDALLDSLARGVPEREKPDDERASAGAALARRISERLGYVFELPPEDAPAGEEKPEP